MSENRARANFHRIRPDRRSGRHVPRSQPSREHGLLPKSPPALFGAIKRTLIEVTGRTAADGDRRQLTRFVDHWFSPESEQRRKTLLESMRPS
jgi:hypothetical protein